MTDIISSDNFIELFITLKQLKHLKGNNNPNLYNVEWSFNITDLKEFILHSKQDYRYSDFLNCFDFTFVDNIAYSMNLVLSLNRAMSRHLLTGIYDNIAYISRYYTNFRIVEENERFISLMNEFIENFEYYCFDKNTYIRNSENFRDNKVESEVDNSRMIIDLQRRIVKKYEG